jgi:hypothetical protein
MRKGVLLEVPSVAVEGIVIVIPATGMPAIAVPVARVVLRKVIEGALSVSVSALAAAEAARFGTEALQLTHHVAGAAAALVVMLQFVPAGIASDAPVASPAI